MANVSEIILGSVLSSLLRLVDYSEKQLPVSQMQTAFRFIVCGFL